MDKNEYNGVSGSILETTGTINGTTQKYSYYLPKPIPKEITLTNSIVKKLAEANLCIGELKGLTLNISKNVLDIIIKAYKRREAWLSTKIEGTHVSLTDIFLSEAGNTDKRAIIDIKEVRNYIIASDIALERLNNGRDINKDFVNEMHNNLLNGVRGSDRTIGQYRSVQNWIEGVDWRTAKFIPLDYRKVDALMEQMFSYMRDDDDVAGLIKIGMMHYFFETIHPYEDGNGRLGRALIVMYLKKLKVIEQPILYPSPYFEKNRQKYYSSLMEVRTKGDYLVWLDFFLDGICETSRDTSKKVKKLIALRDKYEGELKKINAKSNSLAILDLFFENPFWNIPSIVNRMNRNYPLVKRGIDDLIEIGFVEAFTLRKRNKYYYAMEVRRILEDIS